MKKIKTSIVMLFLSVMLAGGCCSLFAKINDLHGQGFAHWGDSKTDIKNKYTRKIKFKQVNVTETDNNIFVDYRGGQVMKKKYDFQDNKLYRITLTYRCSVKRIIESHNRKYKPFTKLENNTYTWKFPSTTITYKNGSNYAVFIAAAHKPPVDSRQ
jgi:hypothetical protein